jgi:hypothetical protein
MRWTVETDRPQAFDMPRELQWVASGGVLSSVCTITASMRSSSMVRGAPDRAHPVTHRCDVRRNGAAICPLLPRST